MKRNHRSSCTYCATMVSLCQRNGNETLMLQHTCNNDNATSADPLAQKIEQGDTKRWYSPQLIHAVDHPEKREFQIAQDTQLVQFVMLFEKLAPCLHGANLLLKQLASAITWSLCLLAYTRRNFLSLASRKDRLATHFYQDLVLPTTASSNGHKSA